MDDRHACISIQYEAFGRSGLFSRNARFTKRGGIQ